MAEDLSHDLHAPALGVGARLRAAREAAGLSLADMAARTKIHERSIAAIEAGDFAALASRTYAVGFSRSLARIYGLDEQEVALAVRTELGAVSTEGNSHGNATFEPGDPSRVPSSRTAWLAAAAAFVVALSGYFAWNSFYSPGASLPSLSPDKPAQPQPAAPSPAQAPAQGPVVFTALEDRVWVKFYDAAGTQLLQKELALGESYTVPADAQGPLLWTARPDALQVAVAGRVLPQLSDVQTTLKDVPVSAAALLSRAAAPAPAPRASTPAAPVNASPAPQRRRPTPPAAASPSTPVILPPALESSTNSE